MIFYSVYYWVIVFACALIRMKLPRKSGYLFLMASLNMLMILIAGPVSFLFLILLISIFLLLKKILSKWVAFILILACGIFLKNILGLVFPMSASYFMLAILGLVYRRDKVELQLLSTALLFPLGEVGPIVRAEETALTLEAEKNIKYSFITIFAGFICLSLGTSQNAIINQRIIDGADLILHFFSVLNLMFLNFQGAVLIAIGSAELLGFSVAPNFNSPYFSTSIKDFWGRWHISMGRFFSEHVFQPMQLSLSSKIKKPTKDNLMFIKLCSLLLTWILIALWHKTTWSFILWGFYNAILVAIPMDEGKSRLFFLRVPFTLILIWIGHTLFLSTDVTFFENFLISIVHVKFIPEHLSVTKIIGIAFNFIIFYFSQKMFSWKEYVFEYLNRHPIAYYIILIAMFFVSLIYHYKRQFIIYGQF
jgi:hypothetical protein